MDIRPATNKIRLESKGISNLIKIKDDKESLIFYGNSSLKLAGLPYLLFRNCVSFDFVTKLDDGGHSLIVSLSNRYSTVYIIWKCFGHISQILLFEVREKELSPKEKADIRGKGIERFQEMNSLAFLFVRLAMMADYIWIMTMLSQDTICFDRLCTIDKTIITIMFVLNRKCTEKGGIAISIFENSGLVRFYWVHLDEHRLTLLNFVIGVVMKS